MYSIKTRSSKMSITLLYMLRSYLSLWILLTITRVVLVHKLELELRFVLKGWNLTKYRCFSAMKKKLRAMAAVLRWRFQVVGTCCYEVIIAIAISVEAIAVDNSKLRGKSRFELNNYIKNWNQCVEELKTHILALPSCFVWLLVL